MHFLEFRCINRFSNRRKNEHLFLVNSVYVLFCVQIGTMNTITVTCNIVIKIVFKAALIKHVLLTIDEMIIFNVKGPMR